MATELKAHESAVPVGVQHDSEVRPIALADVKVDVNKSIVSDHVPTIVAKSHGVYFRNDSIYFGSVEVGKLTRVKLEVCNCTDDEVCIGSLCHSLIGS